MFDRVIRGGTVVDGTGAPGYRADVGLEGGRIAAVEPGGLPESEVPSLDATGLVVAPGFVDMHSHSDLLLLADPAMDPKIRQGFTTEHVAQDGLSVAPVTDEGLETVRSRIAGLLGRFDLDWKWRSFADYLDRLDRTATATNPCVPIPHGTLRTFVAGAGRRLTPERLDALVDAMRVCLEAGAVGMTTGLIYPPCSYSDREELVALCGVLAEYDSFVSVHLRSEGATTLSALEEMLSICRDTGCGLNVSHLKIAGRDNWHVVDDFIALLERYRADMDVSFDQYPYTAGSTLLDATLPPWVHEGGAAETLARLTHPRLRKRIKSIIQDRDDESWENFLWFSGPEGLVVSAVASEENQGLVGQSFADIATARGCDPVDAIFDLLVEERLAVTIVSHSQSEDVVEAFMKLPYGTFCTDGIVGRRPHPRLYGTAPRVLGEYVRERGVLSLEEAVRRLSAAAWSRLGFDGEGTIAVGRRADLVCFDAETVRDTATFEAPVSFPEGLPHVVVGGVVTLEDGESTGERGGAVVRRV